MSKPSRRSSVLGPEVVAGLAERVKGLIGDNYAEAARRIDLPDAAPLHKLANGRTEAPSLMIVARLARAYGKTVEWLLWGEERGGSPKDFQTFPYSRPQQLYRHIMHPASVKAFGDRVTHHDRHAALLAIAREERYSDEEMAELHELIAAALRHQDQA